MMDVKLTRSEFKSIVEKEIFLFENRKRILNENIDPIDLLTLGMEYVIGPDARVGQEDFIRYTESAKSIFPQIVVKNLIQLVRDSEFQGNIDEIVAGIESNAGSDLFSGQREETIGLSPEADDTQIDDTDESQPDDRLIFERSTNAIGSSNDLIGFGAPAEAVYSAQNSIANVFTDSALSAGEYAVGEQIPPTFREFLSSFVGKATKSFVFGFIDNFILILAGNAIDTTLGDTLGLSPMASAGIGNALSDAVGEFGGETIDNTLDRMGVSGNVIPDDQMENAPAWMRLLNQNAGVIGIIIGCLVGMVPLMFMRRGDSS